MWLDLNGHGLRWVEMKLSPFTDSEGTDYYFWVVIDDLDSTIDPLWNQPLSSLEDIAIPSGSDKKEALQGSSSSSSNR